jgi:ribosome biogenesis GTPase
MRGVGAGMIEEVLPRSSELENPRIANVDMILLVFALDNPPLEPYQVSRFLIAAEAAAMPFSIVLNKVGFPSGWTDPSPLP